MWKKWRKLEGSTEKKEDEKCKKYQETRFV